VGTANLRQIGFGIITLSCVLTLVGCDTSVQRKFGDQGARETSAVTSPERAKLEIRTLYEATRDLIPGDWSEGTGSWGPCRTESVQDGVEYNIFSQRRNRPLPSEAKSIAEEAQDLWARHGHSVEIEHDQTLTPPRYILSDPPYLTGSSPSGLWFRFTVGEDYADFTATSRCVSGDQDALNGNE
jgi:hypothetical protein